MAPAPIAGPPFGDLTIGDGIPTPEIGIGPPLGARDRVGICCAAKDWVDNGDKAKGVDEGLVPIGVAGICKGVVVGVVTGKVAQGSYSKAWVTACVSGMVIRSSVKSTKSTVSTLVSLV